MIPGPLITRRGGLTFNGNVNVIVDGNSIYGTFFTPIATLLAELFPISGSGASTANAALSAQTWAQMAENVTDVAAAFVPGKTNILVCGETTNSIANGGGRTAVQAWGDCTGYVALVKTACPGIKVILCGSLPARVAGSDATNPMMQAWDQLALAQHKAHGVDRFVYFRNTEPFNISGLIESEFTANQTYWHTDLLHVSNLGKGAMCNLIAPAIASLSL